MNATVAVAICSNALLLLGDDTISSFDEEKLGAKVSKNLYETTLLALFAEYSWNFATKNDVLTKLSAAPSNRWDFAYQLPTDHIRTITTYPTTTYDIVGDKLYANEDNLTLDYMYRTDESFFPPLFREALELHLASKFAIPVTENATNAELYFNLASKKFSKAKLVDSQEKTSRGIPAMATMPLRMRHRAGRGSRYLCLKLK